MDILFKFAFYFFLRFIFVSLAEASRDGRPPRTAPLLQTSKNFFISIWMNCSVLHSCTLRHRWFEYRYFGWRAWQRIVCSFFLVHSSFWNVEFTIQLKMCWIRWTHIYMKFVQWTNWANDLNLGVMVYTRYIFESGWWMSCERQTRYAATAAAMRQTKVPMTMTKTTATVAMAVYSWLNLLQTAAHNRSHKIYKHTTSW